jgi:hypothetical protein
MAAALREVAGTMVTAAERRVEQGVVARSR